MTLPSPGLFSQFWDAERSAGAYPTLDEFLWDVAAILRDEVEELARLGATYLQLDAPHYPLLLDARWRVFYEERGSGRHSGSELDNHVLAGAPGRDLRLPPLPRQPGQPLARRGELRRARRAALPAHPGDRLLLEYDDERSGGFEPLREVPEKRSSCSGS